MSFQNVPTCKKVVARVSKSWALRVMRSRQKYILNCGNPKMPHSRIHSGNKPVDIHLITKDFVKHFKIKISDNMKT